MDLSIIVEVDASNNPAVGNNVNSGKIENLPSIHIFAKFQRNDLSITLSSPLTFQGRLS